MNFKIYKNIIFQAESANIPAATNALQSIDNSSRLTTEAMQISENHMVTTTEKADLETTAGMCVQLQTFVGKSPGKFFFCKDFLKNIKGPGVHNKEHYFYMQ